MQSNLSMDYIKCLFDYAVFKRGLEYYRAGHVSKVVDDGSTITANVDGSDNNIYQVTIERTVTGKITSMRCSCPYYTHCKHAAAVLIFYVNHGAHINIKKEIQNPLAEPEKEIKDIVFDIKESSEISKVKFFLEPLEAELGININRNINPKERWKLVFILDIYYEGQFYYSGDGESHINLSLGLIYIKKDGSEGRISDFKSDKLTEPLENENEKKLYNVLIMKDKFSQRIDAFFDFLLDHPELHLYLKTDEYKRVIFHKVDETHVNFNLVSVNYKNKAATFSSDLSITDKEENILRLHRGFKPIIFLDYILFPVESGDILYKKCDNIYSRFISNILEFVNLNKEDIDDLHEFVDKHLKDQVKWEFRKERIKTLQARPKPVLEIHRFYDDAKTFINLIFRYFDREIDFTNKDIDNLILGNSNEDNEITVVSRDKNFEKDVMEYLFFKLKQTDISKRDQLGEGFDFIVKKAIKSFLVDFGLALIDDGYEIRFKNQKSKIGIGRGKVSVKISSGIDWFDVNTDFITEDGESKNFKITPEVLKNGLIQIGENFVLLSKEDIEKLSKLLDEGMSEDGKLKISKQNFGVIDSLYSTISNNDMDELKFAKEISSKLKNFKKIENNKLPKNFNGTLREYQVSGYNWLHFLNKYNLNGCLADDMGLGKTVQTLAFLQKLKEDGKLGLSLLVVPVTTVPNWENEIGKFAPQLKYIRHHGYDRIKERDFLKDYDIIISSYHTLRNDIEFFNEMDFDFLILDEAQNIKNSNSLIFKTVRIIKAKHKLSLTGTPIENNTTELWSQFNFLNPSLLGSINEFKRNFTNPIEVDKDAKAAERLRKIIYPFILRRKKEEVAKDLPEKEEIVVYCEMNREQKHVYNTLKEYYKNQIGNTIEEKGIEKSSIQIFEALLRLRQTALFPSLVSDEYKNVESIKFETLKDLMEEILEEDHKVLLFSQFVQSLKIIEKEAKDKKLKYSYIDGQTKKRDLEIKKFQEEKDVNLFLLSLKAGGVGINLTAADYVILFDPWWNPAAESQAVDRSHRIGQTKKVMVYKLIVKDTVEEKILELQNKKKELVSQLITEEASFFKSLNKSDIMNLFS